MSRPVRRDEILPLDAYQASREQIRASIIEAKSCRRLTVGGVLTLLFENTATIRYQVQEMVRAERMTRDPEIAHELDTYNEVLGRPGELGVVLLIEIADADQRDRKLREWLGLIPHLYLKLEDGTKVRPSFDARQVGDERLSAVQYLKFDVQGRVPVAAGSDLPLFSVEDPLTPRQQEALREDLSADS